MALTGLDRPDLAERLGMTVRQLAAWETCGLPWATTGHYRALADAADVMVGWFYLPPPPSAIAASTHLCAGPDHREDLQW
jgi:transcriptional regulator with XRE-family HTH domain